MTTSQPSELIAIPAVYMRGGTSRALVFHARDLPAERSRWDAIFAAALGSPDDGMRQLDGLGGGISSLSKVAVVGPPTHPGADVDFTFGQVAVDALRTSYKGNCGNISAAIGPFAIEEGLVACEGDTASVRIHNSNTGKIIRADFPLVGGRPAVDGDFSIAGVAGTAAPIRLAFLDPGGAATGKLLPTGQARETIDLGGSLYTVSHVDAANPVLFVRADELGMRGDESPSSIAADIELMIRLEELRVAAALAMGLARDRHEATTIVTNLPLVAILSSPPGPESDIQVRMISAGQPHKATPLTGALCLAVAAALEGSIVSELARRPPAGEPLRILHPGGILAVDALFEDGVAREAIAYRTARRLMQGEVLIRRGAWTP